MLSCDWATLYIRIYKGDYPDIQVSWLNPDIWTLSCLSNQLQECFLFTKFVPEPCSVGCTVFSSVHQPSTFGTSLQRFGWTPKSRLSWVQLWFQPSAFIPASYAKGSMVKLTPSRHDPLKSKHDSVASAPEPNSSTRCARSAAAVLWEANRTARSLRRPSGPIKACLGWTGLLILLDSGEFIRILDNSDQSQQDCNVVSISLPSGPGGPTKWNISFCRPPPAQINFFLAISACTQSGFHLRIHQNSTIWHNIAHAMDFLKSNILQHDATSCRIFWLNKNNREWISGT